MNRALETYRDEIRGQLKSVMVISIRNRQLARTLAK